MPWHFGGPKEFKLAEAVEYVTQYRDAQRHMKREQDRLKRRR